MPSGEYPSATLREISDHLRRAADGSDLRARWEGGIDQRLARTESDVAKVTAKVDRMEDRVSKCETRIVPKAGDTQPIEVPVPPVDPLVEARRGEIAARTRFWLALVGLLAIVTTALTALAALR